MFVTRSIDKFSYCISTQGIIVVVESRACEKNIDYFRAPRAETEVYRSWILYAIVLKANLIEVIFLIAFYLCRKCDKEFNFLL